MVLELFITILSVILIHTYIAVTSLVFNLVYYIMACVRLRGIPSSKEFKKDIKEVENLDDVFALTNDIVERFNLDPLKGVLNYFIRPFILYLKNKILNITKSGNDCQAVAYLVYRIIKKGLLYKVFKHNDITKCYYKVERLTFFSVRPFIVANHVVTIAYFKYGNTNFIDIFSPYEYVKTLPTSKKGELHKVVTDIFRDKPKYSRYYFKNWI